MADVLLYWNEIQTRDLPRVCLTCGDHDADWAPRRLHVLRHRILYRVRERVETELPFCPVHFYAPFIQLGATRAWDFTRQGVVMINVAPEFVEALEHYRDMSERREEHELSKRRRKLDLAGANRTDEMEPPPRRPRPSGVGPSRTLGIVLLTLGITGAAVILGGLCCAGLVLPRLAAPGPAGFGPAQPGFPHGNPAVVPKGFGPNRPR